MPDIPETVALAQPILYLFAFTMVSIVIIFVGVLKYIVDKFIKALELFGGRIMDKLDVIEKKVDHPPVNRRGRRGLT